MSQLKHQSSFRVPGRMQRVQSPVIPVVGEMVKAHAGTISLGQGVVYYGPPPQAFAAIERFTSDPENNKYKLVQGIPSLLDAIGKKLASENQIRLDASNTLVVTAGGNMAFMNAVLAITDPGDEVILLTPYYFNHDMAIVMAGCQPVLVPTDENYQLQVEAIRAAITPKTRAVVTVSPNNPSGAVYPETALRAVNGLCRERGLYHISDEAYEYFVYPEPSSLESTRSVGAPPASARVPSNPRSLGIDGAMPSSIRHFSPASIPGSAPHTISLFSLSKAYGFASWRIGYMVVPEQLAISVKKIQDTILICAPVISQFAAVGALEAGYDYCRARLEKIGQTRELLLSELETMSSFCSVPRTDGAFYFLMKLNTPRDPLSVVEQLIREHRVAVIPGTAFGMNKGCYLRVAYGALERGKAEEGIRRLAKGLKAVVGS